MNTQEVASFITSNFVGQILSAGLLSMAAGQVILWLLPKPWFRKFLAFGLNTAKAPGWAFGLWIKMGPLKKLMAPVVCFLVFIGFWFFGFMDALLSKTDSDTQKIVEGLEKVLGDSGSTDRKLYIQSKMNKEQKNVQG